MKTYVTIGSVEGIDGQLHHSDHHRANAFNEFFSSVFTDENPDTAPAFTTGRGDLGALSNIDVTPDIVFDKLNLLKPGKSPGPDGWPSIVLKRLATQLCVPFAIFTKSLRSGLLPQDWKTGYIVPIFKKGSKTKVNNYRPVCLTSVVIKLLESIVRDALFSHISQNNLFSDSQHGFVPHRSCSTQFVHALNDWTSSLDKGFATDVIYFDFSKAFDSVPHVRLIKNLKLMVLMDPC